VVTRGHLLVAFIRVAWLVSSDCRAEGYLQHSCWQHGGRLRPQACLFGGLHPFRAGAGARFEEHLDWLPMNPQKQPCQSAYAWGAFPKPKINPSHSAEL